MSWGIEESNQKGNEWCRERMIGSLFGKGGSFSYIIYLIKPVLKREAVKDSGKKVEFGVRSILVLICHLLVL